MAQLEDQALGNSPGADDPSLLEALLSMVQPSEAEARGRRGSGNVPLVQQVGQQRANQGRAPQPPKPSTPITSEDITRRQKELAQFRQDLKDKAAEPTNQLLQQALIGGGQGGSDGGIYKDPSGTYRQQPSTEALAAGPTNTAQWGSLLGEYAKDPHFAGTSTPQEEQQPPGSPTAELGKRFSNLISPTPAAPNKPEPIITNLAQLGTVLKHLEGAPDELKTKLLSQWTGIDLTPAKVEQLQNTITAAKARYDLAEPDRRKAAIDKAQQQHESSQRLMRNAGLSNLRSAIATIHQRLNSPNSQDPASMPGTKENLELQKLYSNYMKEYTKNIPNVDAQPGTNQPGTAQPAGGQSGIKVTKIE